MPKLGSPHLELHPSLVAFFTKYFHYNLELSEPKNNFFSHSQGSRTFPNHSCYLTAFRAKINHSEKCIVSDTIVIFEIFDTKLIARSKIYWTRFLVLNRYKNSRSNLGFWWLLVKDSLTGRFQDISKLFLVFDREMSRRLFLWVIFITGWIFF